MSKVEIRNLTSYTPDAKSFSQVAKKVLSGENRGRETVSLVFLNKAGIQQLNRKFRQKNKPTDVLSFNLDDKECLGEIVICPELVKKYAERDGETFKYQMKKIWIHGLLHLLGYDHEKSAKDEKIMDEKQEKYLSFFRKQNG